MERTALCLSLADGRRVVRCGQVSNVSNVRLSTLRNAHAGDNWLPALWIARVCSGKSTREVGVVVLQSKAAEFHRSHSYCRSQVSAGTAGEHRVQIISRSVYTELGSCVGRRAG